MTCAVASAFVMFTITKFTEPLQQDHTGIQSRGQMLHLVAHWHCTYYDLTNWKALQGLSLHHVGGAMLPNIEGTVDQQSCTISSHILS